jgi:hypothetical protein
MGAAPVRAAVRTDAGNASDAALDGGDAGAESFGLIGLGHSGGFGGGRMGGGGTSAQAPLVRLGQAVVTGGLAREAVRRIILRNVAQVRFCYETGLRNAPGLRGAVSVAFQIAPDGRVSSSRATPERQALQSVSECIAASFRRWVFPSPTDGAVVSVTQPITLAPTSP